MSVRDHLHHLSDLLSENTEMDWQKDWPYLAILILVTLLTGPLYLLSYEIQRWNTIVNPWDRNDHWAGTKAFAITFIAFDVLLVAGFFHFFPQWATPWSPAALLARLLAWNIFCSLLAPTLALILERVDPQTRSARRVRLPSEQPPPPKPAPAQTAAAAIAPITQPPAPTAQPVPQKRAAATNRPVFGPKKKGPFLPHVPRAPQAGPSQAERKQHKAAVNYVQPALIPDEQKAPPTPAETAPPSSGSAATESAPVPVEPPPEPPPAPKQERRKPEPLDHLF